MSISSTFYSQLFCQFPFAKKLQTQTINTEKFQKTLLCEKTALKMLVKLTPSLSLNKLIGLVLFVEVRLCQVGSSQVRSGQAM